MREKVANGETLDIRELETGFRDAALRGASILFSKFLSEIPDVTPICPDCGKVMRNKGKRTKTVVSMLGEGEISRNYCECENCNHHSIPKDELLNIENTSYTQGVKRVTAKLASCDSFENSSADLKELCGISVSSKDAERIAESIGDRIEAVNSQKIEAVFSDIQISHTFKSVPVMYIEYDGTGVPMIKRELAGRQGKQDDGTAKTRDAKLGCIFTQTTSDDEGNPVRDSNSTTYFGAIETAEQFGKRLYSEAVYRGVDCAEKVVVIGDGAKWIWNLANENFPGAIEIVDLFHAKEHVWDLIRQTIPSEKLRYHYKKKWYALLENGNITELTAEFASINAVTEEQQKAINREIGYFNENSKRMQYAKFKEQHLFVGSGVIEAGCKNVIGKRLKQSGMHWSLCGANTIIALRCAILSGSFDDEYERIAAV